jgi:hypothetical protein
MWRVEWLTPWGRIQPFGADAPEEQSRVLQRYIAAGRADGELWAA